MREIDVLHQGVPRAICAFTIDDVLIDPGPESAHRALVDGLDGFVPRAILLTHIHFDHAGATARLLNSSIVNTSDVQYLHTYRSATILLAFVCFFVGVISLTVFALKNLS